MNFEARPSTPRPPLNPPALPSKTSAAPAAAGWETVFASRVAEGMGLISNLLHLGWTSCGSASDLFAALIYPLWGRLAGHVWPQMPAFGVAPCPTTILTIGMLLMGSWQAVRWLLILPGLWAAVGGSAAILLGVPQDFALLAALLLLVLFAVARFSGLGFARHAESVG